MVSPATQTHGGIGQNVEATDVEQKLFDQPAGPEGRHQPEDQTRRHRAAALCRQDANQAAWLGAERDPHADLTCPRADAI